MRGSLGSSLTSLTVTERLLLTIFAVALVVMSVIPIVNNAKKFRRGDRGSKDYPLWFEAGDAERHDRSPYLIRTPSDPNYAEKFRRRAVLFPNQDPTRDENGEFAFMYPPGTAGLMAPLSLLGKWGIVLTLIALQDAAWVVCVFAPVWLLTGRVRGVPLVLYWFPSLVCFLYIYDVYLEGQMAFMLAAGLLGMFVLLRKNRPLAAGALLALATAVKAFPVLALPYLIYRRQWKAVVVFAVTLPILLLGVPSIFRGPSHAWADLMTWRAEILKPNTPTSMGRAARSYTWQNGSILSVAHRWLRPVVADDDDNLPPLSINVANIPFKKINTIANGAMLALGLAYLAVTWRHRRDRLSVTAEMSILLILIVMCSPMSFTYNTSWIMCGLTTILFFATDPRRPRTIRTVAVVWMILALLPLVFSIGGPFRYPRAMGNTLLGELILSAELGWLLFQPIPDGDENNPPIAASR